MQMKEIDMSAGQLPVDQEERKVLLICKENKLSTISVVDTFFIKKT